ncbi:uncharacterized protein FOMMEDRAFT_143703 [Fomitiporia mediterranea MF3/22]|uniref:uncharacterized protein n=1 Tax=Fomitiporia mediterranea (strain MF3/22) TaxID=694068 RepID=UPI00044076AF|nr:uncharacterized protein FOMMEDRAFT_143703 [Fomitiporia mediterranea MF3/22]EJD07192.1 hypothetical protein FOMMEDRAFT_143703 [Fomitiporia mediterranea MF3/22]
MKRPAKDATKKKSSRQSKSVVKALITGDGLSASSLPKDRVRKAMGLRKAKSEYTCVFSECKEKLSEADVAKHVEGHLKHLDLASGATCPVVGCKRTQKDLPARKRHVLQAHLHAGEQYCEACSGSFSRVSWDQVIRHLETKPIKHAAVWKELGLQWKVVGDIGADKEDHTKEDTVKVEASSDNGGVEYEFIEGSSTGKKRRRL